MGTSTFAGGIAADSVKISLKGCNTTFVLETDATGALTCGADAGTGTGDAGFGVETINAFTGNGTWTKASYVGNVYVEVWGAGGGGGGGGIKFGAAGGGGGGYAAGITSVTGDINVFFNVLAGAGGTGGTANLNGGTGSNVSFRANGGAVNGASGGIGLSGNTTSNAGGGAGGAGAGGNLQITGQGGGNTFGAAQNSLGGSHGGGSARGGAGGPALGFTNISANGNQAGSPGGSPGGGGGGGSSVNGTGGAGGGAMAIVWALSGSPGSDLAEYFVVEDGVEPGDVVAIGPGDTSWDSSQGLQKTSVLKKATPEDRVVGVISTSPYMVMNHGLNQQRPSDTQPVALSGTAYVKVSTANGPIKKGDLLAASNIPGVAVRTDKAGLVVGSALEDYPSTSTSTTSIMPDGSGQNTATTTATTTNETGKVLMFISTTYSTGSRTKAVLAKYGVDMDAIPGTIDMGRLLLAQMLSHKQEITASTTLSEIYTDRVMAGLEIISPRVLTDTLVVNAIEPFDKNVTFKIAKGGKLIFIRAGPDQMSMTFGGPGPPSASSTPILTIDDIGNAFFSGAITIGSKEKPSGITLYDTVTGEPYCIKIAQGVLVRVAGECIISELLSASLSTVTSTPPVIPSSLESSPSLPTQESPPTETPLSGASETSTASTTSSEMTVIEPPPPTAESLPEAPPSGAEEPPPTEIPAP